MLIITLTPCCGGTIYQFGADAAPTCSNYRVTVPTDSKASTISYTDCQGIQQVISHPAVVPPIFNALVFEFCALEPEDILTVGNVVQISDCSPEPLPDWIDLDNLPNVIKWTVDGVTECYTLTSEEVDSPPTGLITPPLSVDVDVLEYSNCDDAREDTDCICEPPFPAVCYELQDCAGVEESIFTRTDLSNHIGQVITLADDTNHEIEGCWVVIELGLSCFSDVDVSVYKCFEDCAECLPVEIPPRVPCPRPVYPGYSTGLCDPDIVEGILCSFSDLTYKKMISKRYGVKFCCPKDEEALTIEHEIIKMKLRESENPTPDPCNPLCSTYEITIDGLDSAITTYVDCNEDPQEIITPIGTEGTSTLVGLCGLNTTPPTVVVTHPDLSTDTYTLEPTDNECVPPYTPPTPTCPPEGCVNYSVATIDTGGGLTFDYINCDGDVALWDIDVDPYDSIDPDVGYIGARFCGPPGQTFPDLAIQGQEVLVTGSQCGICEDPARTCDRIHVVVGPDDSGIVAYINCANVTEIYQFTGGAKVPQSVTICTQANSTRYYVNLTPLSETITENGC